MRLLTLDASVVLKWHRVEHEPRWEAAMRLREEFQSGRSRIVVPGLLHLELLNIAGRKWGWGADQMAGLGAELRGAGYEVHHPDPVAVAAWVGRGLTAYDAAYVAIAMEHGTILVTDDRRVVQIAGDVAVALTDAA